MTEAAPMTLLMIRRLGRGSEAAFRAQIRIATARAPGFAATHTADPDRVMVIVRAFLDGSIQPSTDGQ